jgi:uncharacterized repeat protein (TIGR03803 family)
MNAQGNRGWAAAMLAAILMMLTATIRLPAQTLAPVFTTLHVFDRTNGAGPEAGLIQAADGNLYGITSSGGLNNDGTVFKMSLTGILTTLYSFDGIGTNGSEPSGMTQATDGNFYGTTTGGGVGGYGTVFKITPGGVLTTLYNFSSFADGAYPNSGLIQASDGNLYGTTYQGGINNYGTLFKITPDGALTTLYHFCSQEFCTDGSNPDGTLVQGTNGNLYSTTAAGGTYGWGTVFRITPSGLLTRIHSFDITDGAYPSAGVVEASDGSFYGTTGDGGLNGHGTIFRIASNDALTTIYNFCSQSGCADGEGPAEKMIQATDGNFYGTTSSGGASLYYGTAFEVTPDGALTTLYSFCYTECSSGSNPSGALLQDTNGNLYGVTANGGEVRGNGYGTVFSLSVGLGPFVKTQPTSGAAAASVKILGTSLTGATSVTFNGTPATFTVQSPTAIKTTVPVGATSGPVQVVTPSGTLTSNVNFQVLP